MVYKIAVVFFTFSLVVITYISTFTFPFENGMYSLKSILVNVFRTVESVKLNFMLNCLTYLKEILLFCICYMHVCVKLAHTIEGFSFIVFVVTCMFVYAGVLV